MSPAPAYLRRQYVVPESLEDDVAACLIAAGALGCEIKPAPKTGYCYLEAWFPAAAEPFDVGAWPGVEERGVEPIEEQDWLAHYRAQSRPFSIGRFRIDPRERSDLSAEADRIDLHVPAENAFGTGSHESTRLMLVWLQDLELRDRLQGAAVLDVGCGSGILSFAVERLGAGPIIGFDLDVASVITARLNGQRNACVPLVVAGTAAAFVDRPHFDIQLVNVLPERVFGDLPRLVRMLKPGGLLLSSGNLVSRRTELLGDFESVGLRLRGEKEDGEWLSFLFERR